MTASASGGDRKWRDRITRMRVEVHALYLACRHPDTPWYAKAVAALVVGHTLSPIDLIPDFIPVLGYLDDLILLPLGILIAVRLIPTPVMQECRAQSRARAGSRPRRSWLAGAAVVAVWGVALAVAGWYAYRLAVPYLSQH